MVKPWRSAVELVLWAASALHFCCCFPSLLALQATPASCSACCSSWYCSFSDSFLLFQLLIGGSAVLQKGDAWTYIILSLNHERAISVLTTVNVAYTTVGDYFTVYSRFLNQSASLLSGCNFCNLESETIALGWPLLLTHLGVTIYFQFCTALLQTISKEDYLENSRNVGVSGLWPGGEEWCCSGCL